MSIAQERGSGSIGVDAEAIVTTILERICSTLQCVPLICVVQYRQDLHPGRRDVTLPPEHEHYGLLHQKWLEEFCLMNVPLAHSVVCDGRRVF